MKNNNKSPLTDKPLRNPGQSLDEQINDLLLDDGVNYIVISTGMAGQWKSFIKPECFAENKWV